MLTVKVWLLVISNWVYSGQETTVQHQMYPTLQDCTQVGQNLPSARGSKDYAWRCIETTVFAPK